MNPMTKWLAAVTASVVLVASGLVHGFWTDRWRPSPDVTAAAQRLDQLSLDLGHWKGEAVEIKAGQGGAGVAGCIQRRYVHRRTGAAVVVAVVCGRPGPVSIHTPDACYGASGYEVGRSERIDLPGRWGALWRTDATRKNATDEVRLRVLYGWHTAGGWQAPADARQAFAREKVLHKLYLVRELGAFNDTGKDEPCDDLLQVLLPELDRALFHSDSALQ
jgi:hypothetical protein